MQLNILAVLLFAASVLSQATVDPATNISFVRYTNPNGYSFGVALPLNVTTDFIGQIVSPLRASNGWGAVSLGGAMVNKLLLVAWPNGTNVTSSFRWATAHRAPAVYAGAGKPIARQIPQGTSANDTHFTYTFLCQGCILSDGTTFTANDTDGAGAALAFAISYGAVLNPTIPESAGLSYHDAGRSPYTLNMIAAKSAHFSCWSKLANS